MDAVCQNPYVLKAKETGLVYKNKLEAWLRSDENFVAPYLSIIEQKTGVNRVIVFLGKSAGKYPKFLCDNLIRLAVTIPVLGARIVSPVQGNPSHP